MSRASYQHFVGEEADPEVFFGADESALEDHMQSIKNTRESAELTLPLPTRKMEVDNSIEHTATKRYSTELSNLRARVPNCCGLVCHSKHPVHLLPSKQSEAIKYQRPLLPGGSF